MVNYHHKFFIFILIIASAIMPLSYASAAPTNKKIVIAIDAGHGGKDPGALGQNGLKEKEVNFAVAKKLQALLAKDPLFQPVLTRTGDNFIEVSSRSDIARTKNAHFLVSIHADAALNTNASGASVWVLSNKRADTELGRWLEQQDKQSELLGGGGTALANTSDNRYLSQTVIDLQFAHSQRVGYDVAVNVLNRLDGVGNLHKSKPEHVSFGVLRSPDIPSILVEVGFISNKREEKLLATSDYQNKLANAIYRGIRDYFIRNPMQSTESKTTVRQISNTSNRGDKTETFVDKTGSVPATQIHVVKKGDTLSGIASQYKMSSAKLRELNQLKRDTVYVGQKLKVVAVAKTKVTNNQQQKLDTTMSTNKKITKYKVVAGDSLSIIAQKQGVPLSELKRVNKLTSDNVRVGQVLNIP